MSDAPLDGRRVLVVGASAGIGRALAVRAVRAGGKVVLAARRAERLAAAVEEAGGGLAVAGDVCVEADCRRIVAEAAGAVGPLDLVVYAAGAAPLRPLAESDTADWRRVLDTNVLGATHVIRAAVGEGLMAPGGVVAVLSSEAAHRPRHGLGAYGASKAALEASLRTWRIEHPEARFSCVSVGATFPTEFGDGFDMDVLTTAMEEWTRHGLMQREHMTPEGVAGVLVSTLAAALAHPDVGLDHITLRSPSPPAG